MKYIMSMIPKNQEDTPKGTVTSPTQTPGEEKTPQAWNRFLSFFGFKQLSDEEYLSQLRRQRTLALTRIAELEAELGKETANDEKKS